MRRPQVTHLLTACLLACAASPSHPAETVRQVTGDPGLGAADDPTVHGARLFPDALDDTHGWGVEPGGGVRVIVAGLRFVSLADGSMLSAPDRLPATPSSVVALPERLGGGFVFAHAARMWRSETWLGPARPFSVAPMPIAQVLVGLDRIYVRSPQGVLAAFDPRTSAEVGLGPLPGSPSIGRIAAFDGWRAVAIADLRGALLTSDAGSTWRPLAIPIDPTELVILTDSIAVGGLDEARQMVWWEVRPDGMAGRLSSVPVVAAADTTATPVGITARTFGPRPLAAAIEDGWPLRDGTALVARDGIVARIRLIDGAIVETVSDAFPLRPARCHALSLARAADPGAVGFACGEAHGRTVIYRWQALEARLVELRHFDDPREVLGFGNGALAARGTCAADAHGPRGEPTGSNASWCVMPPGGSWRDLQLGPRPRTPFSAGDRIVVLSDGQVAVVRPPEGGGLASARLTVVSASEASEIPLTLPALPADVARALALGVWMDGFEERKPGILGGWVDAAGSIVGVEIALEGAVRVGEYIRDAGGPVASGRWALGWTASRRGFETTDGGMTWKKEIPFPEPIASGRGIRERACGPIGCIAAGWLRVGWSDSLQVPTTDPRPLASPAPAHASSSSSQDLDCEPLTGPAPAAPPAPTAGASGASAASSGRSSAGVYAGSTAGAVSQFPPFLGRTPPAVAIDQLGYTIEASNGLERALRAGPLAQLYAWGPKSGDWDQLGRWQVRWQWPWGGWTDARSSLVTLSPWPTLDAARRALSRTAGFSTSWALAGGDDPDHALLVARHTMSPATAEIIVLETDRPPVEVRRPAGEPFADLEGAVRLGARWYVATSQSPGELPATVLWVIEGGAVRELVRVPRAGFESRPGLRLARRLGGRVGREVGLVVDGQPDPMSGVTLRWVAAVDVESGAVGSPEPLAPVDLSDRPVTLCAGETTAEWQVDLPYPGTIRLRIGGRAEFPLQGVAARMRISRERACIEQLFGSVESDRPSDPGGSGGLDGSTQGAPRMTRPGRDAHPRARVDVRILSGNTGKIREEVRCGSR